MAFNKHFGNKHIGLIGGGQLGRMIIYEALKWDVNISVLDPSHPSPCSQIAHTSSKGSLLDYQSVYSFGKEMDLITTEIEHINTDALEKLELEGKQVYPQSQILKLIQNKVTQKRFFENNKFPTVAFKVHNGLKSIISEEIHYPKIWKSATMGYDGRGVKMLNHSDELNDLPDVLCLIEDNVNIKQEVAILIARNEKGDIIHYPIVEMLFNNAIHQLEYIVCPGRIAPPAIKKATEISYEVIKKMKYVGLMAIEFFVTHDNDVLINEIAPRPHNSGHHTIEASYTSQFQQHLRAILGLKLGNTKILSPAVMINLVGADNHKGPAKYNNIDKALSLENVYPHIYGKAETKPNRKMGHITVLNKDIEEALRIARQLKTDVTVTSQITS